MRRLRLPRLRHHPDHAENIRELEDWADQVRRTIAPRLHGAGKTNAVDADFLFKPADGMTAIVHDDTTGNTWLSARDGGAWRHVQLT